MKYDYCILNGKKSSLIKGLMIQSLPIISKPMMRANIEEIDGRDGDIITKLGFAAYDRTMKIGLYGDFDIYEVLNYFNSDGEAIFSNEPEMIYKYHILNQIDFEKLLRFRTADVVFHCQPFKHSSFKESFEFDYNNPLTVCNRGNVYSRPNFIVYDSNLFATAKHIYVDNVLKMTIKQPSNASVETTTVVINNENMQATAVTSSGDVINRYVTCDYTKCILTPGVHTLTTDGFVTISETSRWI